MTAASSRGLQRPRQALLRRLPQRSQQGSRRQPDARVVRHREGRRARRRRRADDPQAAGEHDAAAGHAASRRRDLSAAHRRARDTVDAHAKANPNPGGRPFQRLNRAEYARAIKDLLELEVDAAKWLPHDTMSANFDNIADEQALSPTLLEAYLNAAADISRWRWATRTRRRSTRPTRTRPTSRSIPWDHVEGRPIGTRGGMVDQSRVPGRRRIPVRGDVQLTATTRASRRRHLDRRPARGAA